MNEWINIFDYKDSVDSRGKKAGTIIITTNRSGGKTTSMLNASIDYYKKTGRCMLMIFRKKKDLDSVDRMYDDVLTRRNDVDIVMSHLICKDLICELCMDDETFAYGVCLKDVDDIKKYSAVFGRVDIAVLDEYQTETGIYLPDEVGKMVSLITSISRGGGYSSRSIQLYLLGNNYTLLNPYLMEFGFSTRYRKGMKKMRGYGVCAYFIQVNKAKEEMEKNAALDAFRHTNAYRYATESDYWIADSSNLIGKPKGKTFYLCTIKYGDKIFGLWDCANEGFIALTKRYIDNYRHCYCLAGDGSGNGVRLMKRTSHLWKIIQSSYDEGMIRFADLECKNVMMMFLSKGLYAR